MAERTRSDRAWAINPLRFQRSLFANSSTSPKIKMAELSGFGPPRDLSTPTGGLANRCLTRLGLQLQEWRKRRISKSHTASLPLLAVFKTAPLPLGLLFQMAEGRDLETLHEVSPATGGVRSRFLAFRITLPKWWA